MNGWAIIATAIPVSVSAFVAQLPEGSGPPLVTGAVSLSMLSWFMWRDGKDREERAAALLAQLARDKLYLDKLERVAESMDNLTRGTLLEMTNRPQVVQRAKEDAEKILDKIGRK